MPTIANIDIASPSLVEWSGFLDEVPTIAMADGRIVQISGKEHIFDAHDGLLCAQLSVDGATLVTGGEDGSVCRTDSAGSVEVVHKGSGKWVDRIATGPGNSVAFSSGKIAVVINGGDVAREIPCERTIEGMAFAPKGMRLAMARYNGVELHWVNSSSPQQFLEWKGAHNNVFFSPDGKYVVSSMQENALHGWRISDQRHMRMTGYPTKVKSVSWSQKGKWLATSGAPAAIVWPFSGKDGPMGKTPKELGSMGKVQVTQVSCHPGEDVVALGYANGMILLVKIDDGKEVPLRREGNGAISSLAWDKSGSRLAFGSSEGDAGIVSISDA